MKQHPHMAIVLSVVGMASVAMADTPHMGGQMNHILVSLFDNTIYAAIENPGDMPLTLYNYGEHYSGGASVLNRSGYNAQYGWLANGFIDLPPDAGIWIEPIDVTEGLRTYEALTFDPIFGTDSSSSLWQWDGSMTHNWYAAYAAGDYQATYNIFVGTLDGQPYPGYTPGQISLTWSYPAGGLDGLAGFGSVSTRRVSQIPAPGSLMLLSLGVSASGVAQARRRCPGVLPVGKHNRS